jgi:molybdenum cofactor cytidylyltransferase
MPFVSAATVAAVARRSVDTGAAVVPVYAGRRGHPIALPGALRHTLLAADPASNLKAALAGLGAVPLEVAVDDPGILQDVDVKADLRPGRLWP